MVLRITQAYRITPTMAKTPPVKFKVAKRAHIWKYEQTKQHFPLLKRREKPEVWKGKFPTLRSPKTYLELYTSF